MLMTSLNHLADTHFTPNVQFTIFSWLIWFEFAFSELLALHRVYVSFLLGIVK